MSTLRICTYNIHKGFSQFNRRLAIHDVRERLHQLGADVVFLQEVQGQHLHHARRHTDWPEQPQHEFLAGDLWRDTAYGGNALYDHGHHGNAILSRHPILSRANQDVSDHRFERRGLLHCEIRLSGVARPVHCVCVHLGLTAGTRRRQMAALVARLNVLAPPTEPLIIAGDFNDWRNHADDHLIRQLGVVEVFTALRGRPARSFPCHLPMLRLDRIYVRGFAIDQAEVHFGAPWNRLSDHAPLTAQLRAH
ncbi:MAG TPA: endonuclease/exonuclease/phosphatase family protein [Zoogloea sp.]|uniref:endonuclease/exonuclease/phosphatase family protein n=1 Tax=Zoogloea sp. TaxID=49181 RepID=UPI002B6C06A6|nr:endonuclease/exonuclease/phosphatase family protein [Zoogloea sp.]HMV18613.1 endonuclease/exonuclease/phosphatase family protein [Rhodocyclaceae bacterium]HMV62680.1 endonuclease/exonuclease/phosphatase family protein [Rhodocyclaceae bacterium]HMW51547.1 endonuclease/exonuclease/phosphatase family protein [Rhodocyclaceae bacterium]HMY49388.1 endonuclease/exonuclease/phosphatase family protein [Rhodocyclaceae bacterium]HMZ76182.1 endonuclease/exonuclease/phosphatase family protein [Rhodocycl